MGWSCAGANQVWSLIGSGLASERCGGAIPSFRRAPGLLCSGSRPVTEANLQSITQSELRRGLSESSRHAPRLDVVLT